MARTPTQTPEDQPGNPDGAPSREDEILMREIDEAVRQDDTLQFFQKYGTALGSAVALILVGMFGYWWWDSTSETSLEAQSEAIVSGLDSVEARNFDNDCSDAPEDSGCAEGAIQKVDGLIDEGSTGARTMARFLQAGAALEEGETAKAVELYASVAADSEAPQALRDLALIREVSTNFDDRKPEDIIAKLSPLVQPGNAYYGSAGELVAIAHLERGNREEAGKLFSTISQDEEIPETLRNRTRQMAGLLGVDAIVDVEELLEEQRGGPPVQAGS